MKSNIYDKGSNFICKTQGYSNRNRLLFLKIYPTFVPRFDTK